MPSSEQEGKRLSYPYQWKQWRLVHRGNGGPASPIIWEKREIYKINNYIYFIHLFGKKIILYVLYKYYFSFVHKSEFSGGENPILQLETTYRPDPHPFALREASFERPHVFYTAKGGFCLATGICQLFDWPNHWKGVDQEAPVRPCLTRLWVQGWKIDILFIQSHASERGQSWRSASH